MNFRNIKLTIAYDGSTFLGWQKTKMGRSVEQTLQEALQKILQEPLQLQAASRTDAGVHAQGQVVNFLTTNQQLTLKRLQFSLNSLLNNDLVILSVEEMPPNFHPTLDCQTKEYRYFLCNDSIQFPQDRYYEWHYPYHLDDQLMQQAVELIQGRKDFAAFSNTKKNNKPEGTIREVLSINIVRHSPKKICISVQGRHFLYRMVRNIVGTLVYVGQGKRKLEDISKIFETNNKQLVGMTAPAHGLVLYKVDY